jgi:hypothetical protein
MLKYSPKRNIYVIIKLKMYIFPYKNKQITKTVEIFKCVEGYN